MTTQNFKVRKGLTVGEDAVTIDGTTGAITVAGEYTLPVVDGTSGQVLTTDGAGAVTFQSVSDINTTYTIDASSTSGGANFNLVGSDASTDTIKFASGTGVTVSQTSANEIGIAIGQSVATSASPTFNNLTLNGDLDVKGGDITNSTGALLITTASNGNITLTPNGTGIVSSGVTQMTDGSRVLGQILGTRSTTWTAPASGLTTVSGSNGIAAASTTGYGAQLSATYYSGDTTAGTNTSAAFVGRGATGTNTSPTAAASGQVLATFNADGYATSGWAQMIATTNSGAGTTAISPAQLQFYTREAFADNGTSVTNAGTGLRVRLFNSATAMSTANRVSIIDHTTSVATYKAATFNIQASASATNYGTFGATGTTIGGVDSVTTFTRVRGASAGTSPSLVLRNSNTVAAAPATGDGTTFRLQTAGSNATSYTLADIAAQYSATGDDSLLFQVANGDQTTGTFSGVTLINTKPSITTINAGTPSATPGAITVSPVASFGTAGSAVGYTDNTVLLNRTTAGTPGVANQKNAFTIESRRSDQSGVTNTDQTGNAFRVGGTGNYYWTNQIASQYMSAGDHTYTIQAAAGDQTSTTPTWLSLATFAPTQTVLRAGTAGSGGATATKLTVDAAKITAAVPVVFPTYTKAAIAAVTGAAGWQVSISDSTGNGGRMAYWDTTNARWNYVSDDTAV